MIRGNPGRGLFDQIPRSSFWRKCGVIAKGLRGRENHWIKKTAWKLISWKKPSFGFKGVTLQNVRLDDISIQVAEVLELAPREVMVVDVREDHIVLDVLRPVLKASQIAGKGREILRRVSRIPGVTVTPEAAIHSEGALGWVCLDQEDYESALKKASLMGKEIRERIAKRAIVFSTGFEVQEGLIADTNFPLIEERLKREGYTVSFGGILPDHQGEIFYRLQKALDEGFGLILTTGGVGAEEKDCTVEALLRVDPPAATPYIVKLKSGREGMLKTGSGLQWGEWEFLASWRFPGPRGRCRSESIGF